MPVSNRYRAALARGTRTESGSPGQDYWSNEASYQIQAELDPESATLRGFERIVYRNNSPHTLPSIVLNLYQNIFTPSVPRNRYAPITGGVELERVSAQGQTLSRKPPNEIPIFGDVPNAPAGYSVQGTLARVRLPTPIPPGDSAILEVDWQHVIPPAGAFRTAWEDALGARAFLVAQWYPQVASYDDLTGWDATPYLGDGEFYLDYADFDVSIGVPSGFLVGATGELVNPEDVLTDEALLRLERAADADSITRVVTEADLSAENATQQSIDGQLTWRFLAEDVRDFAFATSGGYVWDATRAEIPDEAAGDRSVLIHSFYRPGAPNWERAAIHGQHATEFFSEMVVPYPYPQMTMAEGPITGMEYPMLTFIYRPEAELALYSVIAHEIAHEWFPMLAGQDEAEFAWMDEGAATYMEAYAVGDFFGVEPPFPTEVANYLSVAGSDVEVPLMRHTDLVSPYGARVIAAYSKPAVLLRSLEGVMGAEAFHEALATYAREWAGRHPAPWDFFATMERFAGRELDWFFGPWWFETDVLDLEIVRVESTATGSTVVVRNTGGAPAPAALVATTATGATIAAELPAGLKDGASVNITLPTAEALSRVVIDPEQLYPDVNRENNVWEAGAR